MIELMPVSCWVMHTPMPTKMMRRSHLLPMIARIPIWWFSRSSRAISST